MAKIQFKAILHKLGLWLVVKDGPHKCPPSGGGGLIENHNDSNNYFRGFPSRFSQLFSNMLLSTEQIRYMPTEHTVGVRLLHTRRHPIRSCSLSMP